MNTFLTILKLFPTILAAVQAIEVAVPLPAAGKAKLDLILGAISDVYDAEQNVQKEISKGNLLNAVTLIVTRIVSTFNTVGIFQKSAAQA